MATTSRALHITEKAFQSKVVDLARLTGWHVFHPYDMRRSEPGWPDLTLVRGPRLVFAELKTATGKLSSPQIAVLGMLQRTAAEVYIWRPADMDDIVCILRAA